MTRPTAVDASIVDPEGCRPGTLLVENGRIAALAWTPEDRAALRARAAAVVDAPDSMRVIGTLTEQYALRRYTDELEKRRRELSGE